MDLNIQQRVKVNPQGFLVSNFLTIQGISLFNKRRVKALGKVVLHHLSGAMADRWINKCKLIMSESKAVNQGDSEKILMKSKPSPRYWSQVYQSYNESQPGFILRSSTIDSHAMKTRETDYQKVKCVKCIDKVMNNTWFSNSKVAFPNIGPLLSHGSGIENFKMAWNCESFQV